MRNISKQIKELREKAQLSQNELAREANVSVGFISKLEAGKYGTISLDKCQQLAKGLKVELKTFLEELGYLENQGVTPKAEFALQNALRSNGLSSVADIKQVIDYSNYLKHRHSHER